MLLALLTACPHPVDITLTNAQIAPAMAGDRAWDGPDKIDPAASNLLGTVVGKLDPSGSLTGAVKEATGTLILPDPAGVLEFRESATSAPVYAPVPEAADTLGPMWAPGAATLRAVTVGAGSTLRVTLVDKDLTGEDPIGVVLLTPAQLRRAEASDGPLTIATAEATAGQVLSVSVLVVPTPR